MWIWISWNPQRPDSRSRGLIDSVAVARSFLFQFRHSIGWISVPLIKFWRISRVEKKILYLDTELGVKRWYNSQFSFRFIENKTLIHRGRTFRFQLFSFCYYYLCYFLIVFYILTKFQEFQILTHSCRNLKSIKLIKLSILQKFFLFPFPTTIIQKQKPCLLRVFDQESGRISPR